MVVVPDNRRCRKRGVRVPSAPNPRLSRGDLANDTARAAEREGINVSDDVLHELRKCIKRGGGSNLSISRLRHDITEFLLMYLRVYRQRPSAKKNRQDLEKILKAIERLQRAMPRANDPTYRLLFDRRFAWGCYAGGPEWTEFLALADKFEEMGLTNFPDILELAHTFIVTAEKLVGTSRDRKHVGLHNEYHSHSCFRQGAIHTPDRKREQAVVKPPAASAARGARRLPRQASR